MHLSLSGSVDNFLSVEQLNFSGKRGWDGQTQLYQVTKKNSGLTSTTQPCQLSSRPGLRAVHDMQIRQKPPLLTPQDGVGSLSLHELLSSPWEPFPSSGSQIPTRLSRHKIPAASKGKQWRWGRSELQVGSSAGLPALSKVLPEGAEREESP